MPRKKPPSSKHWTPEKQVEKARRRAYADERPPTDAQFELLAKLCPGGVPERAVVSCTSARWFIRTRLQEERAKLQQGGSR